MGSTHDLSTFGRDGCVVDFAKLPLAVAWGQATLNPTAVHESKRVSLPVWTKPAEPPKPFVSDDDLIADPNNPPVLPPASRARMRECGREWQTMKKSGADRDRTWRDFATGCLTRTP